MPHMIGENLPLPESVQSRRRQFREKLQNLRQPIKKQRENLIPGPNLIGQAETQFNDLKNKFFERNTLISRIKQMRSNESSSSGSGQGGQSGNNSGNNSGVPAT